MEEVFTKYSDIERIGTPENSSIFSFPDDEIVVEEKVDGGNGCFFIDNDGKIHVCSRNRDLTTEDDENTFKGQREALIKILAPNKNKINNSYYYYIEWMQKHTINYGNSIPPIIGLDIRPKSGISGNHPNYLGRKAKEKEFEKLGISVIALKAIVKSKDISDEKIKEWCETSAYYPGKPEGIVLKNYSRLNSWGKQMFVKIVIDEFKEMNKATFGGLKKDTSSSIRFVDQCISDARIKKRILALTLEGGNKLDRKLMHLLPVAVIRDAFKEETDWILRNCSELDLRLIKAQVAKKCLEQIDAMILINHESNLIKPKNIFPLSKSTKKLKLIKHTKTNLVKKRIKHKTNKKGKKSN